MPDPSPSVATSPLAGLRVVDLTRVLAGPVCGRILADLGADVIKIEPPDGDLAREIAPKCDRGNSGLYTLANVGKRNVSIDLAAPGARELVLALYAHTDVVLENFRPGVADRLGIGGSALREANPRAIYCALSGFGSASALRDKGAYAPMMHAVTGVLDWEARSSGLPVSQIADNKADMAAGMHGAIAVLAALVRRGASGRGERLEVPLFDALLATYSETAYALLPEPEPREESRLFDAGANGFVVIAGTPQNAWMRFRTQLSAPDPALPDADVPTKARLRHAAIEDWMRSQRSPSAIEEQLERAGLSIGLVVTLPDALHAAGRSRASEACSSPSTTAAAGSARSFAHLGTSMAKPARSAARPRSAASTTPRSFASCSISTPSGFASSNARVCSSLRMRRPSRPIPREGIGCPHGQPTTQVEAPTPPPFPQGGRRPAEARRGSRPERHLDDHSLQH